MTNTADDKTLERIRKYLAIAEHPGTSSTEAETFRERAYKLMANLGITRAALAASGQAADEITSAAIMIDNAYQKDRATLAGVVAYAKRCRSLLWKPDTTTFILVHGYRSDLEAVQMLYSSLALQMAGEVSKVTASNGTTLAAARKSFMLGWISRVGEKLEAAENAAAEAAPDVTTATGEKSMEVVLLDRRSAVDVEFARLYPNTRTVATSKVRDAGAYYAGREAGDRADIGTRRVGKTTRAINA